MPDIDPDKSPTALFCALESALRCGDFNRAAELRAKLSELGIDVKIKIEQFRRKVVEASK